MTTNLFSHLKYSLLVATIVAAPSLVMAVETSQTPSSRSTEKSAFCTKIETDSTTLLKKAETEKARVKQRRDEEKTKRESKRTELVTKVVTERTTIDAKRIEHFTNLEAKATTDAQKAAVLAFKTAVTSAVTTRRVAMDSARKEYIAQIDAILARRSDTLDTAVSARLKTYQETIDTAKTTCQGSDNKMARATFLSQLKNNRSDYTKSIPSDKNFLAEIKTAHEVYQSKTVKKINDNFKAAIKKAQADFRTAFTQK